MTLWAFAALYIGGIIGAGFASGQELIVFFVDYGKLGLVGTLLATSLFSCGSYLILEFCATRNVQSYGDLIAAVDPRLNVFFDLLYSFFLLVGMSVMLAGAGGLLDSTLFNLLLRAATASFLLYALCRGVHRAARISSYLAPFLVFILCALALYRLVQQGIVLPKYSSNRAFEAAGLYVSYNLGFSLALLTSIHQYLRTKKERFKFALGTNLILGICLILLFLALNTLDPSEQKTAFPLIYLLAGLGGWALNIYKCMLWAAMYSTAIANGFALLNRISMNSKLSWFTLSLLIVVSAFSFSFIGFATLIRLAYPVLGLAGLYLCLNILREHLVEGGFFSFL